MKTSTEPSAHDSAKPAVEVLRRFWLSWWDGVWLWLGLGIAGTVAAGVILGPAYLVHLILPDAALRMMRPAFGLLVLAAGPVVLSRVFRALDNTRPWERKRREE